MAKRAKSKKSGGRKTAAKRKSRASASKSMPKRSTKRAGKTSTMPKRGQKRKSAARSSTKRTASGDFGIAASQARKPVKSGGRDRGPDQGTGMERSGSQGTRESAVGWQVGTPGSGSGGDIDIEVIGVITESGNPPGSTQTQLPAGNGSDDMDDDEDFDDLESRHDQGRG